LHMVMDLDHAREILRRIEAGEIAVVESDFTSLPSPFAHNVVLQGVSDLVLMEDRSALLRELHRKVLERVMPTDQISSIQFQPSEIAEYFRRKLPKVARKEDILSYLDRVGDANLLQQKGRTVFAVASASFADVRKWAGQLMDEGLVESVWTPQGIHWTPKDHLPTYVAVCLEPELVEEVLRDLESEGVVSSGHFLVDEEFQFMMTRDLQRLQRKDETREVFDENQVKAFLLEKQFAGIDTLDGYFDRFL